MVCSSAINSTYQNVGPEGILALCTAEVGRQPAVWPDREEHERGAGAVELSLDERLGGLLGQISADDRQHLIGSRRLGDLYDRTLDRHVLVGELSLSSCRRYLAHTFSCTIP